MSTEPSEWQSTTDLISVYRLGARKDYDYNDEEWMKLVSAMTRMMMAFHKDKAGPGQSLGVSLHSKDGVLYAVLEKRTDRATSSRAVLPGLMELYHTFFDENKPITDIEVKMGFRIPDKGTTPSEYLLLMEDAISMFERHNEVLDDLEHVINKYKNR